MKFTKICCYADFEDRILQPLLQTILLCLFVLIMLMLVKSVYG